ncbi:MAG: MarC family protein [Candidatus Omnitrophica bacterium]|nr:MarC family protein [Candidatus Omnitrophota bacterium]
MVWERLWLSFLPLCVAVDALGVVPLYWGLVQDLPPAQRRQTVHQAVMVGFVVALVFLWVSEAVFKVMGIQIADVMIAGGVILFALSLNDLLHPEKVLYAPSTAIGPVPLGVPIIVGPAVLATALLVRQRYGLWPTISALSVNMLLVWVVLQVADGLIQRVGPAVARVVSKVMNLVLAAFAVMLVRQGLTLVLPR